MDLKRRSTPGILGESAMEDRGKELPSSKARISLPLVYGALRVYDLDGHGRVHNRTRG